MNYPIMEPPFIVLPFEEMKKKQVEQYFQWYMTEKENRVKQLDEFIKQETTKVLLDNTAESLIDLWEWFESHIEYQEKTEESYIMNFQENPYGFKIFCSKTKKD